MNFFQDEIDIHRYFLFSFRNIFQIIFEAIGKNTQVIEAIRALADIQDNTVLHETMLTVFARDLAADGSTMLSNLCDLKIKNRTLNNIYFLTNSFYKHRFISTN